MGLLKKKKLLKSFFASLNMEFQYFTDIDLHVHFNDGQNMTKFTHHNLYTSDETISAAVLSHYDLHPPAFIQLSF